MIPFSIGAGAFMAIAIYYVAVDIMVTRQNKKLVKTLNQYNR